MLHTMGLIEQAQKDWQAITNNKSEFGVTLKFKAPTNEEAEVAGLHTKHHLGFDEMGKPVNSKTAYITVSEKLLTDAGYPVRVNGEVKLVNHLVTVKDSTGTEKNYIIQQWMPDETLGAITLVLGVYTGDL